MAYQFKIFKIYWHLKKMASKIWIIKDIPSFETLPSNISSSNLRFYKLCNLVLTLGMFVHLLWIIIFLSNQLNLIGIVNIFSFFIYICSIIINRNGYHFTSSSIMVLEIIIHQIFAAWYLGFDIGFQNFVIVIALFPFLMPKGKLIIKTILLLSCLFAYLFIEYFIRTKPPIEIINPDLKLYLQISNIIFAFTSLAVSGGYFSLAMHDTEDLLETEKEKSNK